MFKKKLPIGQALATTMWLSWTHCWPHTHTYLKIINLSDCKYWTPSMGFFIFLPTVFFSSYRGVKITVSKAHATGQSIRLIFLCLLFLWRMMNKQNQFFYPFITLSGSSLKFNFLFLFFLSVRCPTIYCFGQSNWWGCNLCTVLRN